MINFLMPILSTPFCVHADKTSNFVDLFHDILLAVGLVMINVTSAGHCRYQAGRAAVCSVTAKHTMAATIGMSET